MNRKILLQVTAPAIIIGLLLFGTCLMSAWYLDQLQTNLSNILYQNVASLDAAQQLEIELRQLRFHCFLYLISPQADLLDEIHADDQRFEGELTRARAAATLPIEHDLIREIDEGYERYRKEFEKTRAEVARAGPHRDLQQMAYGNPVRHIVDPCRKLLRLNEDIMNGTFQESSRISQRLRLVMLFLGLGGPVGGLILGYGIARGLSRYLYQLSVRVQDMAQRLELDVASVSLAADGDIGHLDKQLQHVVQRVEEVAERLQRHQRELLRAEQLAAVGQLAASVAHEVRNPLTAVKMLVEAALQGRTRKPLQEEDLRVIHGAVASLEQTVQSFLDFARLPTPRRSAGDLRDVVSQAVELVRARARQQAVQTEVRCPERPVPGNVDHGQLGTVLVNLFLNALDAMPQGGRMTVELKVSGRTGAQLTVADTGPGIPAEMNGRLFTPFASSKPTGTGLGLSLSRRIVEEHGGRLTGGNRPEGGACFTIFLPASALEANPARAAGSGRMAR
jgi:signal transduction histidine kinase